MWHREGARVFERVGLSVGVGEKERVALGEGVE